MEDASWKGQKEMTQVSTDAISFEEAYAQVQHLRAQLGTAVMGRDDVIDLIIVGLLSGGHVLLEDYPGSGKTTLAKALGGSIASDSKVEEIVSFRRIQFTPDLLPSDVTGVMVFDPNEGQFHLRRAPILPTSFSWTKSTARRRKFNLPSWNQWPNSR